MAVTSAQNISGSDGGYDDKGDRNYTEEWQAFTDDVNDHASTVLVSELIPQMFDLYLPGNSYDSGAYVKSKNASRDNDLRTLWHVTIHYSTAGSSNKGRGDGDGRKPDDPLDEEEYITYRTGAQEYALEKAYRGTAAQNPVMLSFDEEDVDDGLVSVVNSANDLFDPPYMVPHYYRILTISRNELAFDDVVVRGLIGTVNKSIFRKMGIYKVRLADVTAEEMRKAGQVYHHVTYELHYNPATWILSALDTGMNIISGGVKKAARDTTDARYGTAVPLDGAGGKNPAADDLFFIPYLPYEPADWGPLNLDD